MRRVAVVGGGPSGMIAAVAAAENGNQVVLFEKNEKLGKKLFITGKGRCNVTNAANISDFFPEVVRNPKFLYSAFYSFTNEDVISFFRDSCGIPLKIERGNRVFPESDHSSDIIRALEHRLRELSVRVFLKTKIAGIRAEDGRVKGVLHEDGKKEPFDAVILAAGGKSYPTTGSDGEGFAMAEELGHTLSPLYPSLVPLITKETFVKELSGLSLRNVSLTVSMGGKVIGSEFGEMLFTHKGISGPIVLSLSSVISPLLTGGKVLSASIDLKPALSFEELDARVQKDFDKFRNREFVNSLGELLPRLMIPVVVHESGIKPDKKVNLITHDERKRLVEVLKGFKMEVAGFKGFSEAIISSGGINVKSIDSGTMEIKGCSGLRAAGEIIDVDALTGGFNLQIAWSTANLAAQ